LLSLAPESISRLPQLFRDGRRRLKGWVRQTGKSFTFSLRRLLSGLLFFDGA